MTIVEASTTTVLEAVRKLSSEIAERSGEIEKAKVVPPDLLARLADAGAFRMFVPRQYGGEQLSLPDAMAVIEELSHADASTGWTVMVGADFAPVFARFPKQVVDSEVYHDGPDAMARGALAPKGIAVPADGGYVVSGQWPLASGSYKHDWMMGNCIVLDNGQPRMTELGAPEMKLAMVPTEQVQFLDTWDSVGLRATNSNDFVLKEVFVPEHHTAELFGPAGVDVPMFRLPIRLSLGPTHVAVALGIAGGALADLRGLAKTKRPAFNPGMRLAEDPVFQFRLGQLDTRLAAARALAQKETQLIWDVAVAGGQIDPLVGVRNRAMVAYVHTACVEIVNEAFGLAGSNAMYNTSTLQRRLRDIRTAAQHVAASAEIYQIAGALLVGEDVPPAALV
ncbi:acyl-CoA dehydrogenase family protein [Mycobacterium seoulense]|uniref:acyl-CoA dehydrogenase family protein n=1 Tax=Mycobacterium seoulense TaxID=386911 RepID=UPI003CEF4DCD